MQELRRKIIITKNGQQIPVESALGVDLEVFIQDDSIKEVVHLDVSDKEFDSMRKQAVTNKIPAAMLRSKKAK